MQPHLADVLIDQYGNYFCQKLFQKLNETQLIEFMHSLSETHITEEQKKEKTSKKRIKNKFLFVSSDSRGTHAIQSLIDAAIDKPSVV